LTHPRMSYGKLHREKIAIVDSCCLSGADVCVWFSLVLFFLSACVFFKF